MTPEKATASFWIVDRAGTRDRADAGDGGLDSSSPRSGVGGKERHSSHRSASSCCMSPIDILPKNRFKCNLMLCSYRLYFLGLTAGRPLLSSSTVLAFRSRR